MSNPYGFTVFADGNSVGNVQTIDIRGGRQQLTDPFRAVTITITGRNLSTFPNVQIGQRLECSLVSGLPFPSALFDGVVSDVQITYGVVANMDTWTITGENSLAQAGRAVVSVFWSAGITTYEAAELLVNETTLNISQLGAFSSSLVSAQTLTDVNVLEVLNQLVFTEQARIYSYQQGDIQWVPRSSYAYATPSFELTDGTISTLGLNLYGYQNVIFKAQADSYFTRTIVEPVGLAAQSSGTSDRVFVGKSYDQTTTQAANLADYVQAQLEISQDVPAQVRILCEAYTDLQNPMAAAIAGLGEGMLIKLGLRGSEYDVLVEGSVISSTPEATYVTLFLSSAEARNFFILDSSTFGVLDSSRLGF